MSGDEPGKVDPAAGPGEPFLSRWSRRKTQARTVPTVTEPAAAEPAEALKPADSPESVTADVAAATPPPAVELPDLSLLGEDSDYSAFLTPGVDADLRRRALRQLFASPKFNVFDGLDTYRDDYTQFPALGDVVTSDMRHHLERVAKQVAQALDAPAAPHAPAATTAPMATIAPAADAVVAPEIPTIEPSAPPSDEEQHDRSA